KVSRDAAGWRVEFMRDGTLLRENFAAVVCALTADALAALPFEGVPQASRLGTLREIAHPPVASVFVGCRRADVAHPLDGFGLLMPEIEGARILGALFSSTLFPGRAPAGHVALTVFAGGTRQPEIARLEDDEL